MSFSFFFLNILDIYYKNTYKICILDIYTVIVSQGAHREEKGGASSLGFVDVLFQISTGVISSRNPLLHL